MTRDDNLGLLSIKSKQTQSNTGHRAGVQRGLGEATLASGPWRPPYDDARLLIIKHHRSMGTGIIASNSGPPRRPRNKRPRGAQSGHAHHSQALPLWVRRPGGGGSAAFGGACVRETWERGGKETCPCPPMCTTNGTPTYNDHHQHWHRHAIDYSARGSKRNHLFRLFVVTRVTHRRPEVVT